MATTSDLGQILGVSAFLHLSIKFSVHWSQNLYPFFNTDYWEPGFITGKYGSCEILDYRRSKISVSAESDRFIPFGVPPWRANNEKSGPQGDDLWGGWRESLAPKSQSGKPSQDIVPWGMDKWGFEWGKEKEQDYHSQVLVKQSQAGHWLFGCLNGSENHPSCKWTTWGLCFFCHSLVRVVLVGGRGEQ